MNKIFLVSILFLAACGPGLATRATTNGRAVFGYAYKFGGSGQMITISHFTTTALSQQSSTELMFRLDSNIPVGPAVLYQMATGGAMPYIGINASLYPIVVYPNGAGCITPTVLTSAQPVEIGKRYHIAFEQIATTAYLYLNGVQVATVSGIGAGNQCNGTTSIIGNDNTGVHGFPGVIDELRISSYSNRYFSTFQPPLTPHLNDAISSLIFHADDGPNLSGNPQYCFLDYFNSPNGISASYSVSNNPEVINSPFP